MISCGVGSVVTGDCIGIDGGTVGVAGSVGTGLICCGADDDTVGPVVAGCAGVAVVTDPDIAEIYFDISHNTYK